jgi:hypothetical protein
VGTNIGAIGKIAAGLAPPSSPLPASCTSESLTSQLAQLPVRDVALKAVLRQLVAPQIVPSATTVNGPTTAEFTWSPDGKTMAVMLGGYLEGQPPSAPALLVYDCATGKVLSSFTGHQILVMAKVPLNVLYDTNSVSLQSMSWTADGQRLMLMGQSSLFVLVLGPAVLHI